MIIVRYAEIGLKGKNRILFEKVLVKNIKKYLEKQNYDYTKINRMHGRIIIETDNEIKKENIDLKPIFGIKSYSYAKEIIIPKTSLNSNSKILDILRKEGLSLTKINKNFTKEKFRVSCKRMDKKFPINSNEIEMSVGEEIFEKTKTKVDLKNYDSEIGFEILQGRIFIYLNKIKAYGGLPVGSQNIVTLNADSRESLLAGVLMLKRGCALNIEGDFDITPLLKYTESIDKCSDIIVNGNTFDNLADFNSDELSPLIGYSKKEIKELLEKYNI